MKHKFKIIFASLLFVIAIGTVCFFAFRDPYYTLKKDVWNQLSVSYQHTVSQDWKSAKVYQEKGEDDMIVEFDAGKQSVLGNIKVHVDSKTHNILKIDPRC